MAFLQSTACQNKKINNRRQRMNRNTGVHVETWLKGKKGSPTRPLSFTVFPDSPLLDGMRIVSIRRQALEEIMISQDKDCFISLRYKTLSVREVALRFGWCFYFFSVAHITPESTWLSLTISCPKWVSLPEAEHFAPCSLSRSISFYSYSITLSLFE